MKHFLASEIEQCPPEQARFHLLPIPLERTVSYGGGTGEGPAAIIEASDQLELWDGRSKPGEAGIHTGPEVDCSGSAEAVMERIAAATARALEHGAMPVGLGGEHSVTWGMVRALRDAGVDDLGVVQIDAHADLRHAYEGELYSHASVMKRVVEADIPLYQLGVRALCEEELEARRRFAVRYRDAEELVLNSVMEVELPGDFPRQVFFTVDIDGLDPSIFPSTGTPVPGGLGWYQTLSLFRSVARQRQIVGFDLTEFAPIPGFHAYSFAAAQLLYNLMGIVQRQD